MTNQLPDQLSSAPPSSAPPSSAPPSSAPPSSAPPSSAPPSASSTGPRTPAGKAISSQNARKHDLCSKTLRLSPEEWLEYNDMRERYGRDLQPGDEVEETLVDEICFNYWRLQQAREAELQIILEHPTELPIISLYIRYRTGYERGYYKALDKLQQTQRVRKQSSKADPVRSEIQTASAAPLPHLADSAPSNSVPHAAVPLAPVPLAAVRSAESQAAGLADQLEDHILENRVRGELALPPLALPKPLVDQLKQFVSQNLPAVPDRLLELMRKAA